MKNLDFKSILFGGLVVCCYLLFTGQTRSNNLGDIVVDSITIKNGDIRVYNADGERVVVLGVDKNGDGLALISDSDGEPTVFLTNDNGGLVKTYRKGLHWAMIGSGEEGAFLSLWQGTEDVFFGSMVSDNKPWIAFFDRFGNLLWGKGLD